MHTHVPCIDTMEITIIPRCTSVYARMCISLLFQLCIKTLMVQHFCVVRGLIIQVLHLLPYYYKNFNGILILTISLLGPPFVQETFSVLEVWPYAHIVLVYLSKPYGGVFRVLLWNPRVAIFLCY